LNCPYLHKNLHFHALTGLRISHAKRLGGDISRKLAGSTGMGFAVPATMAPKSSYRKKHNTNVWHFCSSCRNWPVINFFEEKAGTPPGDEFCPECVRNQQEGTCNQPNAIQSTAPILRKKVLIIDDHVDIRRVLTITLRHLGYATCEASDAISGIGMSLEENPNLILMDLSLPDFSGLETAKRIKQNSKTSKIPIVACSGWKSDEIVAQAAEAGIVEFLAKPIAPELLAEVIERLT
jgi:CheY-like chemotaxis protein